MPTNLVGLVPLRANPTAKQRLAPVLGARERMVLVRRGYEHVVGVLASLGIEVVTLAPHDVEVPDAGELWLDGRKGLNAALGDAVSRVGPALQAIAAGQCDVTIANTYYLQKVGDAFSAGFVRGMGLGRTPYDAAVLGSANEYVDYAASKGAIDSFTVSVS